MTEFTSYSKGAHSSAPTEEWALYISFDGETKIAVPHGPRDYSMPMTWHSVYLTGCDDAGSDKLACPSFMNNGIPKAALLSPSRGYLQLIGPCRSDERAVLPLLGIDRATFL